MTKLIVEGQVIDDDRGRNSIITEWHQQKVEQAVHHFRHEIRERVGRREIYAYCSQLGISNYGDKVCEILGK